MKGNGGFEKEGRKEGRKVAGNGIMCVVLQDLI